MVDGSQKTGYDISIDGTRITAFGSQTQGDFNLSDFRKAALAAGFVHVAGLVSPRELGVNFFLAVLEFNLPRFQSAVNVITWGNMIWEIVSFPTQMLGSLKATVEFTGMEIVDGCPVIENIAFPIDDNNTLTVKAPQKNKRFSTLEQENKALEEIKAAIELQRGINVAYA